MKNSIIYLLSLILISSLQAENQDWFKLKQREELNLGEQLLIIYEPMSLPPNCEYEITCEYADNSTKKINSGKTNKHGKVKGNPFFHAIIDPYPGKAYILHFISKDGTIQISREIIPIPIETVGNDGAKIDVISSDPKQFICRLRGFKPKENLTFQSISCDEMLRQNVTTDEKGELKFIHLPAVLGKEGGNCQLLCIRQNETLQINFPWGAKYLPIRAKDRKNVIPFDKSKVLKPQWKNPWKR